MNFAKLLLIPLFYVMLTFEIISCQFEFLTFREARDPKLNTGPIQFPPNDDTSGPSGSMVRRPQFGFVPPTRQGITAGIAEGESNFGNLFYSS